MLPTPAHGVRLASRRRRLVTALLLFTTLPALLNLAVAESASAAAASVDFPDPKPLARVKTTEKNRKIRAVTVTARPKLFDPATAASLPTATETTVTLGGSGKVRAAKTPISVRRDASGPARVRVRTLGEKAALAAGVHGVLFTVQSGAADGTVTVDVDPSSFRNAYGGDFASRLKLVRLPACALTTPELAKCQTQTAVASTTGLSAKVSTLSAAATVLAATSATGGSAGDYAATSLSPGGTWGTSGNTGAFTYSYPVALPPAIAGVAPSVGLSYSSSAQDARTSGTNNQSSWVGDGWSTTSNFIERTYQGCVDKTDAEKKAAGVPEGSGDMCWAGQILTLSMNGSSSTIVYDDKTHTFHPSSDSATTKIERLTGANNGTDDGEYFRVTENGVQYYFGRNRVPGWASGDEEAQSVATVPVYLAHDGVDACPASTTFADTKCDLGYRFSLDLVVDAHSNAVAYYYTPEIGYYGAAMKKTALKYTRETVLKRIDYGMTASTVYSATAPAQVLFSTAERCVEGSPAGNTCSDEQFTVSNPEYWPDVPVDLNCVSGKDCANHGPSFWSRKRLTSILTRAQVGGATKQVDRYDLVQSFPDNGDHAPTLWLESIKRTGLDTLGGASASASAGTVSFTPTQLPNRVGTIAGLPLMYYHRVGTVLSETGAETSVEYSTPDCSSVPSDASKNTTGCFPVYWTPEGQWNPQLDWFYTHPVTKVTTIDRYNAYQDGSQPKLVTSYAYKGNPGWHFDDNEVVKKKFRTYGQFRGYPEVDVTTGDSGVFHYTNKAEVHDQRTLTKSFYFLGMKGDPLTSTDGTVSVPDNEEYAGQVFETDTYTGVGGTLHRAEITVPTTIGPTAYRARDGLPRLESLMVRTSKTLTRQKVSSGWRKTEAATFYNTTLDQATTGMAVQAVDRGEPGATDNVATCTYTRYLAGATATLVSTAQVITTNQDCTTAGAKPAGTLISDVRTSYDGNAFAYDGDGQSSPARPTKGDATLAQSATASANGVATAYATLTTGTYDSYGRPASTTRTPGSTMADGVTSLAAGSFIRYTPASGALPTGITTVTQVTPGVDCSAVTVSSKDCQLATETRDPLRQQSLAKTDPAGSLTSFTYDALGRLTATWLPNKSKAAGAPANLTYDYALAATAPSVVTTRTLMENGEYVVAKVLYDAMLRQLESQRTGANDSTVVSDVQYDSLGQTVLTNDAYAIAGDPSDALVSDHLSQVSIPGTTVADHDGLGQTTQVTAENNGVARYFTRTVYTGDSTTTIPPAGGVAVTKTANARGQLIKLQQYVTAPTVAGSAAAGFTASGGTSRDILYGYTPGGQQSKVTGPDGAVWTYTYDQRGRLSSQTDPDTGTGTTTYDDAGNVTVMKDARGKQLGYTYDLLGRKLTGVDKSASNWKFASWTYDTLRIGKPTSSTRYVNGVTGGYTVATTGYSALGNALGQTISLPSSEAPLPVEYTTKFAYNPGTETVAQQQDPAVAGLPGETLTFAYDGLGEQTKTAGIDLYVSGTTYTDFGQPSRVTMGASTNEVQVIHDYDPYTLRLASRSISRAQAPGPLVDKTSYTYDDAGNPVSITDEQSESGNTVTDTQCYRYDGLARLSEAWTTAATCATPSVSTGAGAYWQTFTYNAIGDRTAVVDHGATDVTTSYTNGCSTGCNRTGAQPHTLTETKGGADPTKFVYDVAGKLLTRTAAGGNQSLTWDDEGRLAQVTTSAGTTKYVYDADGTQLIRRDPGRTTLFAGDTEITVNTAVTPAVLLGAVRTYSHAGKAVAMRSTLPGGGTSYLFNDQVGTSTLAVDTTSQKVSRQQYKPYGEERTSANTTLWPDTTHGYLGKSKATGTGYTDVGARKYDPALGRFISPDPVMETTDLSQLGGYAYAGDNPIGRSDPSGLTDCDYAWGCGSGGENLNPGKTSGDNETGAKIGGGRKDSDKPSTGGGGTGDSGNDTNCNCGVGKNTITGTRTRAPKFAEYAVIKTGHCAGYGAYDCHISDLDSGEITTAALAYLCEYFKECSLKQAVAAEHDRESDEMFSLVPFLGLVSSYRLMKQDWEEGNSTGAALEAAGMIPWGKVAKYGGKGGSKLLELMGVGAKVACSFSPDTPVLLADGSSKPIAQIEVGDVVLASDPQTGETIAKPVTDLLSDIDTALTDLTVEDAHGVRSTISTTSNHLFWEQSSRQWTGAGLLQPGDRLSTPGQGSVSVVSARRFTGSRQMLNLTVADLHTYFVLTGGVAVLVHNECLITVGEALNRAAAFIGNRPMIVEQSGSGAVQFRTSFINELGETETRIARIDVNPANGDVIKNGPHLNLETQINGRPVRSGPKADPHTKIDPNDVRPGDWWPHEQK